MLSIRNTLNGRSSPFLPSFHSKAFGEVIMRNIVPLGSSFAIKYICHFEKFKECGSGPLCGFLQLLFGFAIGCVSFPHFDFFFCTERNLKFSHKCFKCSGPEPLYSSAWTGRNRKKRKSNACASDINRAVYKLYMVELERGSQSHRPSWPPVRK